jgi:histidyl-tRNA synthetase
VQPEGGASREGYYVITLGEEAWALGLGVTADLRSVGEVAEIDYRGRSMKAQLRTADRENFRWAAIIGEDEVRQGTVTLRDMATGEQETLPQPELISRLSSEAKPQ